MISAETQIFDLGGKRKKKNKKKVGNELTTSG